MDIEKNQELDNTSKNQPNFSFHLPFTFRLLLPSCLSLRCFPKMDIDPPKNIFDL